MAKHEVSVLFISATNTGMGKTYATLRLLTELRALGAFPLCCKPLETGVQDVQTTDFAAQFECLTALQIVQHYQNSAPNALNSAHALYAMSFKLPASPFVSALAESKTIAIDSIISFIQSLKNLAANEILLIEGAGGLFVPLLVDYFMIDLIASLKAPVLLVSSGILGELNTICLSLQALKHREIPYFLWINPKSKAEENAFLRLSEPFLKAAKIPYFYANNGIQALAAHLQKNRL